MRAHYQKIAPPPPPGSCAKQFTYNVSTVQCNGLTNDQSISTADACEQRCCAEQAQGSCNVWQFGTGAEDGGCWFDTGSGVNCGPVHNGFPWVGGATYDPSATAKIVGTRISDNSFTGLSGVGSRAALTAAGPGSTFTLNFCDHLVFKSIALVRTLTVTDTASVGISAHALPAQGCNLTVVTSSPLSAQGVIFVEVDSSAYDGAFV